jgi:PAS domain S-box-containing protein
MKLQELPPAAPAPAAREGAGVAAGPAPGGPVASKQHLLALLRGLLLPMTVAMAAVLAFCSLLYLWDADQIESTMLDRELRRVEIFSDLFSRDLNSTITNLRLLATGDGLETYILTGQPVDLDRAVHRAQFFSVENPEYDQVRFIDATGQEKIRINRGGAIVPPDKLQNKADRDYFQAASQLAPDQIYLSRMDLNVENGAIEMPPRPMLRFAAPVFDPNGQRRGIYVINVRAEDLIASLQNFVPRYKDRMRMLNAEGYWLKAARPEDEWGWLLPGRGGVSLAKSNPALWQQIVELPEGQLAQGASYFTWCRAVPGTLIKSGNVRLVAGDAFYVFGSEISPAERAATFAPVRQVFVVVAALLLVLSTILTWFFQSRQRLRRERDRFFDLTRDMQCVAGFDGYFKRINPAWQKTLGYSPKELLEHPFIDFVHADDREKTLFVNNRLMNGGEVVNFQNRYRCKDGTYRWMEWNARPLMDEGLIFASARDLTERKVNEQQILSLNDEMKHRADQVEAANKELEAFSYSVSHDLRAPLRHIHGFVELLQKSPVIEQDASSVRQMGIIAKAAKQMGALIDDLLAFSRTGRAEMRPVEVDMAALVDQVIHDRQSDCEGRDVKWSVGPLGHAAGDPGLLRLVLVNLLDNALKYTRPRPQAVIEIGELSRSDREVVFFVRDNGVGFDMQYASKLFGVFQRLHRTEDFEGTGIGLANVQRIILRHGGRVWAEALEGQGATFYFSLPTVTDAHPR